MDKIAYCGHHCAYCFYPECPGCRSDNPFCSYATLFSDRKCPNVTCCLERGLDGCYECAELAACEIGFYSTDEHVAKATALFIQQYGKACYAATLERAIQDGVNYPHAFNALGDVGLMLALLERYRG